jgi:type VI secretion system protein ImpM
MPVDDLTMRPAPFGVGLFGKVPALGDFVIRVPRAIQDPLDDWLQDGLAASRKRLGDRWSDIYLTSPIWHMAFEAGVCGLDRIAGVMVPSVDRVGRCFPLVVMGSLPGDDDLAGVALGVGHWYREAENLCLSLIEADTDAEGVDARLAALGAPVGAAVPVLAQALVRRVPAWAKILLWTDGSDLVGPQVAARPDLPPPETFGALFDGDWTATAEGPVGESVLWKGADAWS